MKRRHGRGRKRACKHAGGAGQLWRLPSLLATLASQTDATARDCLALGHRLDLEPPATGTGLVGRIPAFAPFQPVLFRHAEQRLAVVERFGMQ
jgi:hypothetical protein